MRYDPQVAPDPAVWRATDEHARLRAIEDYHHRAALKMPNVRMHAVIHNVVENQLAEGLPEVLATFERLALAGLSRHDALHAVGSVVAGQIHAMLARQEPFDEGDYTRRLQALEVVPGFEEGGAVGEAGDGVAPPGAAARSFRSRAAPVRPRSPARRSRRRRTGRAAGGSRSEEEGRRGAYRGGPWARALYQCPCPW